MITPLSEALAERGFDTLTPVQQAVTAPELAAADLLVSAQTGSGKTVGFGLAIAPTLLEEAERFGPAATPLALVVAPTRELAFQVMQELRWLYAKTGAVVTSCVGGMDMRDERRALDRGAHIVVGTPGRLSDHIRRGSLDLGDVRAAVLDEADEMLDLGFREDLEFILGAAPAERRTLLFSATVPPTIAKLAGQFQRDAQRISTINSAQQHADISYKALWVAATDGDNAIFNLLRYHDDQSAIVFANTRAAVNHLAARLTNRGLPVVTLSGELSQSERSHALQAMRDGRARVCVATDVAARGIDLPNLTLVIHADLPSNTESLLHRSGRTGRAGRKGISALIVPPKMNKRTERLLKWAKIEAEWTVPPSAEDILRRDEERLLTAPSWDEPITEEEADFAGKLLAQHGAEAVAAALLRMHRARHAAPEELLPPDSKPTRDHAEFGPSRWFALSIGQADRAEPRWLLPLICRNTGLEKAAIGAIRVQTDETYLEIAEASAGKLEAGLGPDGVLDEGIRVRALDAPPELAQRPRKPRPEGGKGGKPFRPRGDKPAPGPRGPRKEKFAPAKDAPSKPAPMKAEAAKPAPAKPMPAKPAPMKAEAAEARPVERSKPARDDAKKAWREKAMQPGQRLDGPPGRSGSTHEDETKPRKPRAKYAKRDQEPGKGKGKPPAGKPFGKPAGKRPFSGKPGRPGKPGGPRSDGHEPPRRGKR